GWGLPSYHRADVSTFHQPFVISSWSDCNVPAAAGRDASQHRSDSLLSSEGLTAAGTQSYLLTVQLITLEPKCPALPHVNLEVPGDSALVRGGAVARMPVPKKSSPPPSRSSPTAASPRPSSRTSRAAPASPKARSTSTSTTKKRSSRRSSDRRSSPSSPRERQSRNPSPAAREICSSAWCESTGGWWGKHRSRVFRDS